MPDRHRLLQRLDEIAASLRDRPPALALLALGSVGRELERLDEYSDLDFFVLVEPGSKAAFLADLSWLACIRPIAYAFQNTADGFKLLFADGIFCEFAVFEPPELVNIPFAPGRIVWKRTGVAEAIAEPQYQPVAAGAPDPDWLLGEALTNLYVGMCRFRRGEKLSAERFIQGYAVDRLVQLSSLLGPTVSGQADPFTNERRFEQRYPQIAGRLAEFVQGYERSPQSARAILAFLQEYFPVNPAIAQAVLDLCAVNNG